MSTRSARTALAAALATVAGVVATVLGAPWATSGPSADPVTRAQAVAASVEGVSRSPGAEAAPRPSADPRSRVVTEVADPHAGTRQVVTLVQPDEVAAGGTPPALPRSGDGGAQAGGSATWEAQHGRRALGLIRYPWRDLGYDIVFLPGRRYYRAMIYGAERRIEVYVRRGDSVQRTAFDIAHELGHAVDFEWTSDAERARWRKLRGIHPSTAWYGCDRCADFQTPAGDFAEVFAYWRVRRSEAFSSRMAGLPTDRQLQRLEDLMRPTARQPARAPERPRTSEPEPRPSPPPGSDGDEPQEPAGSGSESAPREEEADDRSTVGGILDVIPVTGSDGGGGLLLGTNE